MANVAIVNNTVGAVNPDSRILLTGDGGAVQQSTFTVNTQAVGVDGFTYRYVQANGAVAASITIGTVSAAGQLTDSGGAYVVSATAFVDNEYGWVRNATILADAAA